jgi:polar amino acid transport system substrate-binding protein
VPDLDDQRICATSGSTSLALIGSGLPVNRSQSSYGIPVAAPGWTDCLVLLQQGDVAAISTDDSILAGLQAQDPYTEIIGRRLSNEPYGLAISKQHPDFVRFVNAVLAKMRADGQWAAIYKRWIGTPAPAPPAAHYQG